jgi:putative PIN family toxin of toxin-antitoxin system
VRAVFDTNIFISAFAIPGGNADEAYLHAVRGTFELFTSVAILTETATTLQTKFQWSDEKVRQLLQAISKTVTVVRTQPHLECAALAKADVIVTGDRHLLALQRHEETRIVTLAGFLRLLKGE